MFAKFRQKLPGPKATAFWTTAATLVTVYRYNKQESARRLDEYKQRASHAALETIGSLDTPRKVHVYVAVPMSELGTRRARQHWEKYILPVFAAGALDYEITLVNETETENGIERVVRGGVHRLVADEIKDRRRRQLESDTDNEELRLWRAALDERKAENERRELKNKLGVEPGMSALELWKEKEYPGVMDIVAIGRETWIEAVNGVSDGAVGSLNMEMPSLVPLDSEKSSTPEQASQPEPASKPEQNSGSEQTPATEQSPGSEQTNSNQISGSDQTTHMIDYDRFDNHSMVALPAVAYIGHKNLTGWASVPQRIYNFFHDQQNVDEYARQALQVVYETTRRRAHGMEEIEAMGREEEELEAWRDQPSLDIVVDRRVADCLQIYDTQNDNAPPLET
ncbi:mitochondrial import inner membrane translocase subunit tim54 [Coemansia sp. RSA 1199]|nr:mitochondrial import inner membrane translocase subunit tim54 [Coemansia sp. RSA 1199]